MATVISKVANSNTKFGTISEELTIFLINYSDIKSLIKCHENNVAHKPLNSSNAHKNKDEVLIIIS